MFSTLHGSRPPRAAPEQPSIQIVRSDQHADTVHYASRCRLKWPLDCNRIQVPIDLGLYFDDHDIHVQGFDFLTNVLKELSRQNDEYKNKIALHWCQTHTDAFKALTDERNPANLFTSAEGAEHGHSSLVDALTVIKRIKKDGLPQMPPGCIATDGAQAVTAIREGHTIVQSSLPVLPHGGQNFSAASISHPFPAVDFSNGQQFRNNSGVGYYDQTYTQGRNVPVGHPLCHCTGLNPHPIHPNVYPPTALQYPQSGFIPKGHFFPQSGGLVQPRQLSLPRVVSDPGDVAHFRGLFYPGAVESGPHPTRCTSEPWNIYAQGRGRIPSTTNFQALQIPSCGVRTQFQAEHQLARNAGHGNRGFGGGMGKNSYGQLSNMPWSNNQQHPDNNWAIMPSSDPRGYYQSQQRVIPGSVRPGLDHGRPNMGPIQRYSAGHGFIPSNCFTNNQQHSVPVAKQCTTGPPGSLQSSETPLNQRMPSCSPNPNARDEILGRTSGAAFSPQPQGPPSAQLRRVPFGQHPDINTNSLQGRNARPPTQQTHQPFPEHPMNPMNTLYISNVCFRLDKAAVVSAFSVYGRIISASLPRHSNPSYPHRGFGHIEFSSCDEAGKARAAMAGAVLGGTRLRVDWSRLPRIHGTFDTHGSETRNQPSSLETMRPGLLSDVTAAPSTSDQSRPHQLSILNNIVSASSSPGISRNGTGPVNQNHTLPRTSKLTQVHSEISSNAANGDSADKDQEFGPAPNIVSIDRSMFSNPNRPDHDQPQEKSEDISDKPFTTYERINTASTRVESGSVTCDPGPVGAVVSLQTSDSAARTAFDKSPIVDATRFHHHPSHEQTKGSCNSTENHLSVGSDRQALEVRKNASNEGPMASPATAPLQNAEKPTCLPQDVQRSLPVPHPPIEDRRHENRRCTNETPTKTIQGGPRTTMACRDRPQNAMGDFNFDGQQRNTGFGSGDMRKNDDPMTSHSIAGCKDRGDVTGDTLPKLEHEIGRGSQAPTTSYKRGKGSKKINPKVKPATSCKSSSSQPSMSTSPAEKEASENTGSVRCEESNSYDELHKLPQTISKARSTGQPKKPSPISNAQPGSTPIELTVEATTTTLAQGLHAPPQPTQEEASNKEERATSPPKRSDSRRYPKKKKSGRQSSSHRASTTLSTTKPNNHTIKALPDAHGRAVST